MTEERDLDAEIRATLEGMASRPAPDRLLDRVAAIPAGEPTSGALRRANPSRPRLGFSLATAAIATIVIAGALFLRGANQSGATASTPPASASSLVAATPTQTQGQTSSEGTPTPAPSIVAVAPSPSPASSPTSPDVIPADFQPLSVTFVSANMGWVLGSAGCGANTCPVIVRTLDGGRTWTRIAAPDTTLEAMNDHRGGPGGFGLRFADQLDGWAFGHVLWDTHDGGLTWKQVAIPGLPDGSLVALEASAGNVQVTGFADAGGFRMATSPVSSDSWRLSTVTVPAGAGPVPQPQLVLQGQAGWLIENDRVVTGGARLVGGAWQAWQPPCLDVLGPATLAAANAQDVTAVCDVGLWGTPQGDHLYRSSNGGQTFVETGPRLPVDGVVSIAAPSSSAIVVAGYGPNAAGAEVVASTDGGLTWTVALSPGQLGTSSVSYLGFTTATQGVLITSNGGGNSPELTQLLMTRDGGRTWTPVKF